jgi:hypothetical protein
MILLEEAHHENLSIVWQSLSWNRSYATAPSGFIVVESPRTSDFVSPSGRLLANLQQAPCLDTIFVTVGTLPTQHTFNIPKAILIACRRSFGNSLLLSHQSLEKTTSISPTTTRTHSNWFGFSSWKAPNSKIANGPAGYLRAFIPAQPSSWDGFSRTSSGWKVRTPFSFCGVCLGKSQLLVLPSISTRA